MLDQAVDHRLQPGNDAKFIDIRYKSLITDSIGELDKIYKFNGGLKPALTEQFLRHEQEHPHQKHGVHQYSLEDFGITGGTIDACTKKYSEFLKNHYDSL